MFTEMFNEKVDLSTEFAKISGIKKDSKKMGKGDVYFLKDGSSVVIGAEKGRIQYYDKNMEYITSYTRVSQAIKALGQSGVLFEAKTMSDIEALELIKSKPMKTVKNVKTENTYYYTKNGELLIGVEGDTSYDLDSKDQTQDYSQTSYLEKGKYILSEDKMNDLLISIKDSYYGISDSDAKGIVVDVLKLDAPTAKRLKLDIKKEAKIWSKVAELISSSDLGRVL